jgi:hypothetical protein
MEDLELRWNIFARELQDIMWRRNQELSIIDNRTPIHPEKIRRLQKSLKSPKRFPLLNPDDLDILIKAFTLTEDEVIRLRAAILATSVEATLMGRIPPQDALQAAERVFEITVRSLRTNDRDFNAVRHYGELPSPQETSDEALIDLEPALAAIDWATLSMHLATLTHGYAQRLAYLQQARAAFNYALQDMDALNDVATLMNWREEAKRGLDAVTVELTDLDN